jgi:hypothetical protein
MRNALFYWFSFLFLLLSMTSCGCRKGLIQKEITNDTIIETLHDTVFSIEKDSSYFQALLECQNGKVVIKQVAETRSGRKLKTPKVTIKNNQLEVDCETEAERLFASWKDTFIKSYKEINKPIITNELTWLQKTQIYIGRIAIGSLLIWLLLLLFKPKIF